MNYIALFPFHFPKASQCTILKADICACIGTGWMEGQSERPETDCFSPVKAAKGFDPNAATAIPNDTYTSEDRFKEFPLPLSRWPNLTASACSLSLCYKTFAATTGGDILRETLLDETSVIPFSATEKKSSDATLENQTIDFIPNTCILDGLEYEITQYVDVHQIRDKIDFSDSSGFSDRSYAVQLQDIIGNATTNQSLFDSCTYRVSALTYLETLSGLLPGLLVGEMTLEDESPDPSANSASSIWDRPYSAYSSEEPQLAPFFQAGNGTTTGTKEIFDRLADALTNHIRQNNANGTTVKGVALTKVTTVKIVPEWLILPTVLVILSCVFLISTIMRNQSIIQNKVWKSDQTALIYHGLPDCDLNQETPLDQLEDMRKEAQASKVKLEIDHKGSWRLRKQLDSEQQPLKEDM